MKFQRIQNAERIILRSLALVAVVLSLWQSVVYLKHRDGSQEVGNRFSLVAVYVDPPPTFIRTVLPLMVNAAAIWTFSPVGLVVSGIAVGYVGSLYVIWYGHTFVLERQMRSGEIQRYDWYTSKLGLSEASEGDIIVLFITVLFLAWHLKNLIAITRRSGKANVKRRGLTRHPADPSPKAAAGG